MREILFRAYDKGRKEYLSDGHLFIAINKSRHPNKSEIYLDVISNADKYNERFVIEQYTGLPDKNGKKIFEGDIVKEEFEVFVSARTKEKRIRIGFVEYESSCLCCGYYAYFWNDKEKWRGNFKLHTSCEVIGNIHDNPELLKEGAAE